MGRKEKTAKFEANSTAAADKDNRAAEDMNDDEHNQRNHPAAITPPSKPKFGKRSNVTLRRQSARLRSLTSSLPNQGAVTKETIYIEEIEEEEEEGELHVEDLKNSEPIVDQPNSEEEPNVEVLNRLEPIFSLPNVEGLNSEPSSSQQNFEEKIHFLMQSVQELKSRESKRLAAAHQTRSAKLDYRSLYIKSQKMVEGLVEEKHELATKLERANAKIEVYGEICQKVMMQN